MPTKFASVQDSTQENPLKRILTEVLRKSVCVTEINYRWTITQTFKLIHFVIALWISHV